ncbi:MAG: hypothetical protein R3B93_26140 [Bacteroidia bacterium]
MKSLFKKRAFALFEIFVGLIPILGGTLAIFKFLENREYPQLVIMSMMIVTIIAITAFFAIRNWRNYYLKLVACADAFHNFNHLVRDEFYKLRHLKKQNALNKSILLSNLDLTSQESVNILSKLLTELTGHKIHVHLKIFGQNEKSNEITSEHILTTLCISKGAPGERMNAINGKSKHKVGDNTHLSLLFIDKQPHFAASNLRKKALNYFRGDNQINFKCSSENWRDRYRSVVVVPIRIEKLDGNTPVFENLGVLFCDSEVNKAFRNFEMEHMINIVKNFADGLYTYLDRISYLLAEIEDKNQTQTS